MDDRSDAWLVGRARELLAITQTSDPSERLHYAGEVDRLLVEARNRGEPRLIGQLLRVAAVVRVDNELSDSAECLLDELLVHARRHGLLVLQADGHALRGRRLSQAGAEDAALTEAATALAMLDEEIAPDLALGRRAWDLMLATTLMDIGLVLTQLGVYEVANDVMKRARRCVRSTAGPHTIAVHLINRTRLLLAWGLRLERIGDYADAARQFSTAAAIAEDVETPFRDSFYPRLRGVPAADQVPVVGAAPALAAPSAEHIERLTGLLHEVRFPREQIIVAIALSRCHEQAGTLHLAAEVLNDILHQLQPAESEPSLRLCLIREYARVCGETPGAALNDYLAELEARLWAMRESRMNTVQTRREHARLSRRHGTIALQALQDPLTGLPNRRALDDRLEALATAPGHQELAIALVDLDRFKGVNDELSHADGDDVLRVVASTLRDAVRGSDMVARYGGDEFIVLLPGAALSAAESALGRAVAAVAALPHDLSHGVTLSVGVVTLRPQETAARALTRADAAMYQAKRRGGNGVVAVAGAEPEPEWTGQAADPAWVIPEAT